VNRRAKQRVILLIWLASFFALGFGVWSFQAGHLMIIVYLVLSVLLYALFAFTARCPRCSVPILLKPVRLFGMQIYLWSLTAPEHCRHCGETLS
jgi:hypothetical protein